MQPQSQPQPQSHVTEIKDIHEKIKQSQNQNHSDEIRDHHDIFKLMRSRL